MTICSKKLGGHGPFCPPQLTTTMHSTMFTRRLEINVYVKKCGYSSNCKIVPVEILHLIAKNTLPFGKLVKSDHNKNFWYFIISVRSSPDPPIMKEIAVRSSPHPAKIDFSPDPVLSSPNPCSSLLARAIFLSHAFLRRIIFTPESRIHCKNATAGCVLFCFSEWTLVITFWCVLCELIFLVRCQRSTTNYSAGITITTVKYWTRKSVKRTIKDVRAKRLLRLGNLKCHAVPVGS